MYHGPKHVQDGHSAPAGNPGECFWCPDHRKVSEEHHPECVIPQRSVRIRYTIDVVQPVPNGWDAASIEFHRNDSSWCSNDLLDDLANGLDDDHCLCNQVSAEYIGEATEEDEHACGWSASTQGRKVMNGVEENHEGQ